MLEIVIIPYLFLLGVIGGGAFAIKDSKMLARVSTGLLYATLLYPFHYWWALYAFVPPAAFALGHGHFIGHYLTGHTKLKHYELERWEPEILRHHPLLAAALHGAFTLNPAFCIANPVALVIAKKQTRGKYLWDWRWYEGLRQVVAWALTLAGIALWTQ